MGPSAISPAPGVTSDILRSMPSISSRACLHPCSSLAVHMWTEGMCIEIPIMGEKGGRRKGSCMHAVSQDVPPGLKSYISVCNNASCINKTCKRCIYYLGHMDTWHFQPGDAVTHACNHTHAAIYNVAVYNYMAYVFIRTCMHMHGMDRCMLVTHGQFRVLAFPSPQNAHAPSATQHAPKAAIVLGCIRYSASTHQVPG